MARKVLALVLVLTQLLPSAFAGGDRSRTALELNSEDRARIVALEKGYQKIHERLGGEIAQLLQDLKQLRHKNEQDELKHFVAMREDLVKTRVQERAEEEGSDSGIRPGDMSIEVFYGHVIRYFGEYVSKNAGALDAATIEDIYDAAYEVSVMRAGIVSPLPSTAEYARVSSLRVILRMILSAIPSVFVTSQLVHATRDYVRDRNLIRGDLEHFQDLARGYQTELENHASEGLESVIYWQGLVDDMHRVVESLQLDLVSQRNGIYEWFLNNPDMMSFLPLIAIFGVTSGWSIYRHAKSTHEYEKSGFEESKSKHLGAVAEGMGLFLDAMERVLGGRVTGLRNALGKMEFEKVRTELCGMRLSPLPQVRVAAIVAEMEDAESAEAAVEEEFFANGDRAVNAKGSSR